MLHAFALTARPAPRPDQLRARAAGPAAARAQAPTVTSLSPGSGPLGTTLTVDGTNLISLMGVTPGAVPAHFTRQRK